MCRGQKILSVSEQFSSKLESNIFHGFILQPNKMGWDIHAKNVWYYGEGYFGQKKIAEKVRKSRHNVNRDKSA